MKFFAVIAAFTFAATVSASTCGINGALCDGTKRRSVGVTNKAREWLSSSDVDAINVDAREVEVEAREIEALEMEIDTE